MGTQREIKFRALVKEGHEEGAKTHWTYYMIGGKPSLMGGWHYLTGDLQYTGLKDKDGREIYEGDITKDIEGGIGVVEFKATSFRAVDGLGWDNLAYPDECGVIGNIYENPELLQQ